MTRPCAPIDRQELIRILEECIGQNGPTCDLNHIDVSNIYDFSGLFSGGLRCIFQGNISRWDVSNATKMQRMFAASSFTGDIAQWNVSNVTNMERMFQASSFDNDISLWRVEACEDFSGMFAQCGFVQDISTWSFSSNARVDNMVDDSQFSQFEQPHHYHWWTLCRPASMVVPAAWRAHAEIALLMGKELNLDRHGMASWMASTWAQQQSETFVLPEGADALF